ncbi:MAG: alginate export family protein [Verrucomicrobia bacterium]|nr:alginate export family protein [Verrucomicrobiota bacterium]
MTAKALFAAVVLLLATAAESANTGLLNNWLRKESEAARAWDFGGEFRLRYANSEGAVPAAGTMTATPSGAKPLTTPINPNTDFIGGGQPNNNEELWVREKFHAGYSPVSWFTVFAEARRNNEFWDERAPSPDADECDLQQAFIQLGDPGQFPLVAKAGRQELIYGDQRFVGISGWSVTGRVFDAVRLRFVTDAFAVDAFAGHVVVPRQNHFNESNDHDWFSGVYASSQKLLPWQETQLYFLARNADTNAVSAAAPHVPGTPATARDIYTVGMRFKSLPGKLGGWDYCVEAAGQSGSINNSTLGRRLDQESYAVFGNGGYTWSHVWGAPRLGVGYEGGSGDSNSTDGKSETFENLFGTSHGFYGQMDLFCQRNMHIPRVSASLTPLKGLAVAVDCLGFWLADTNDLLYPELGNGRNANGYGIHPAFDSHVGTEVDVVTRYSPLPWLKLEAGYGHFFIGDYIRQSVRSVAANGDAEDANWCYVQTTISF